MKYLSPQICDELEERGEEREDKWAANIQRALTGCNTDSDKFDEEREEGDELSNIDKVHTYSQLL